MSADLWILYHSVYFTSAAENGIIPMLVLKARKAVSGFYIDICRVEARQNYYK